MNHGDSLTASSRLLGLQQKTNDNRTWCNGVVARCADGDLQSGVTDDWQHQSSTCSSPQGTEEHCPADTDKQSLRTLTGYAEEHPANGARSKADVSSRG